MKLFPKSFERRCLFEKRQHPKTFLVFYQRLIFKQSLKRERFKISFLTGDLSGGRGQALQMGMGQPVEVGNVQRFRTPVACNARSLQQGFSPDTP